MDATSAERELRARVRQQEVVGAFGQQALATDDLDQLMHDAAVAVTETLDVEYAAVLELLPDDEFRLRHGVGWRDGLGGTATVPTDLASQADYTLLSEAPVIVEDLRTEDRFSVPELSKNHDVVSGISVVIGTVDEPWGVLGVHDTQQRTFTEHDVTFVQNVADHLASAIQRMGRDRKLQRTKRRFQAVFEDPNILVGLLAPDGTVLDINETAMEYVEADLSAVIGEPFWETPWWGEGDDVGGDVREWVTRAAAGEYVDFEADLTRPAGQRYTLSGYFRPVTDDDGDVVSIIVSDRDVTARKEREREFEEIRRRYETLIEHFPSGVVALVNEDLRYVTFGGSLEGDSDLGRAELEGASLPDALPERVAEVVVEPYEAALAGEPAQFESTIDDRVYQFQFIPVRDDDGDTFAALGMSQDLTERKTYQQRLERANERLTRYKEYTGDVLDAIDDIFYILDENGDVQRWNRSLCEVTGYSDDEIATMNALDFFDAGEEESIATAIAEAYETGHTQVEAKFSTKPGEQIPYEFVASTLEDPEGVPVLAGIGRDITDRVEHQRRLEELVDRLERSNERLEQFAYAASHDLQEPLRMVSSYLQLLERQYAAEIDENGREFIGFAMDGADRMRDMIEGLLQYSRVDTRGDPFEPIDLNAVFADVCQNLEVKIDEHDAEITAEDLPEVYGDRSQLNQVLQNLLDNAIEYSGEEPPQIHISADRVDEMYEISVHDEGIGIDPTYADQVFEVFRSLHGQDESGTGIGLALVERIIERHGGDIWVESEPGEGATFSFTLPATDTRIPCTD